MAAPANLPENVPATFASRSRHTQLLACADSWRGEVGGTARQTWLACVVIGRTNCALNPDILCLTDSWQHRRTGDGVGLDCGVGEETSESFGRIGVLGTDCA